LFITNAIITKFPRKQCDSVDICVLKNCLSVTNSDFNENDINSSSYIQNRPFYKEIVTNRTIRLPANTNEAFTLVPGPTGAEKYVAIEDLILNGIDKPSIAVFSYGSNETIQKPITIADTKELCSK
jgi:hypothetical protein